MEEKEFEELIKRCLSGQATKEETALVEKWLDHRSTQDPYGNLSTEEQQHTRTRIFEGLSSKIMEEDGSHVKGRRRLTTTQFYWAAASILLVSVLSYSFLKFTNQRVEEKTTVVHSLSSSSDGFKKVILSDSSIVWLKGNSSIIYPAKFDGKERNVQLIGEALFEVSKDPAHPFILQCGGLTAKVLGTSFNIKSSETDIEVLVLTGKVALSSEGNTKGLIVQSNEKAVYHSAQNQMAKVVALKKEITAKTTGTEYSMQFQASRMEEIIRRIEGKFDVRVSVSDQRLKNCSITADFTDQSLDRTLHMIAQSLEIEYERKDNQITLKGVGCD